MTSKLKLVIAGVALAALSGTAAASDRISFSISFGTPFHAQPRAYAPPPAYVYAPPAYVYAPAPVYYPAPVLVRTPPRVVYYGAPRGHVKRWNRSRDRDFRGRR